MARDDNRHATDLEAQMTPLERHARWLLGLYPAAYRRERSEEMIGTLLEATPDGRTWPRARDVRALFICGLKARAAQNRQRTAGANLRVAVMAGLGMFLSLWLGTYVYGVVQEWHGPAALPVSGLVTWTSAATALLFGATVVLAWTAPRAAVVASALAASAGVVTFGIVIDGASGLLGPRILQVLALAGLAALAPRSGHASRHWLWLPGAIAASMVLLALGLGYGLVSLGVLTPAVPLLVMVAVGVLWVGVDARLIIAVFTYLAVAALQIPVAEISYVPGVPATLPPFLVVVAIAAPFVWLLRRQSARAIRAD